MAPETHVVTGAFSYTGRYLTRHLLEAGLEARTLTGRPDRESPFADRVKAFPYAFEDPEAMVEALRGASVLYNTYWVRFSYGGSGFDLAVRNTRILFDAAKKAGVRRIVHVSIANPSKDSPLPYYSGKAALEEDLAATGISHAVVRPTVIFGDEDILINNIAWFLRRFPVFAVPGDGEYGIQPIHVEDMAALLQKAGTGTANETIDAVGPETFTFNELAARIREAVGSRARIRHFRPGTSLLMLRMIGRFVGDVILTRQEIDGLMAGLLVSKGPPTGTTRLTDWLKSHAGTVGARYANEVRRHFVRRRQPPAIRTS